jgi:hypothetical protein
LSAANIAERNSRITKRDRKLFFGIARGSVHKRVPMFERVMRCTFPGRCGGCARIFRSEPTATTGKSGTTDGAAIAPFGCCTVPPVGLHGLMGRQPDSSGYGGDFGAERLHAGAMSHSIVPIHADAAWPALTRQTIIKPALSTMSRHPPAFRKELENSCRLLIPATSQLSLPASRSIA